MSGPDVLRHITVALAEIIETDPAEITAEKTFTDDLHVDSLSLVELAVVVEERYGVAIPDEAIDGFQTVADVARYVEERRSGRPAATTA